jgi:hypothetical protein
MITTTSLRNGRDTRPPLPAALGPSRNSPRVLVVRDHNDKTEAEIPLIEADFFIVRQKYRRIEEHFDQQPDTAVLLDHQPETRRKRESRFDGCLF